jgi:hypothetical protein
VASFVPATLAARRGRAFLSDVFLDVGPGRGAGLLVDFDMSFS